MPVAPWLPALGRAGLPARLTCDGKVFALSRTFKHTTASAVGMYRSVAGEALVLKCYRREPVLGLPAAWIGSLVARYEAAVLRRAQDVPGVPRLRGRYGRTGILRDYVPGEPLTAEAGIDDAFVAKLVETLRSLHARGIAYVDLEKASNIIVGEDGRPYLIDFQAAFYVPDWLLGQTFPLRWLRGRLHRADLYHAHKHYRKVGRHDFSNEEIARLRRKPLAVRLANALYRPLTRARRRLLRKE